MQIIVTGDSAVLDDPDNCRAFSVAVPVGATPDYLPELLERTGVGRLDTDGQHVHVPIDTVRHLAEGRTSSGWDKDFAAMISYARTKGWVDDTAATIRGHVEIS
jgi:hypothetical protein